MASQIPDTRHSIILRLSDRSDVEAWEHFVEIYEPLIHRLALAKGFQDADAHEIVQEVLFSVAQAVERWVPDPERGRFRDWLFCIARNLMIRFLTRRKHRALGTGDTRVADFLNQQPDSSAEDSELFDLEYHREVFRWAALRVRGEVQSTTWRAFWRTCMEEESVARVATELGLTVGAVYIARSRVRGRLRELVQRIEADTGLSRLEISNDDTP